MGNQSRGSSLNLNIFHHVKVQTSIRRQMNIQHQPNNIMIHVSCNTNQASICPIHRSGDTYTSQPPILSNLSPNAHPQSALWRITRTLDRVAKQPSSRIDPVTCKKMVHRHPHRRRQRQHRCAAWPSDLSVLAVPGGRCELPRRRPRCAIVHV